MKIATVDDRHRIRIPDLAPGKIFAWENNGNGQITLLEVKTRPKKSRKSSPLEGIKPLTKEEREQCWGPKSDPETDRIAAAMCKVPVCPPGE